MIRRVVLRKTVLHRSATSALAPLFAALLLVLAWPLGVRGEGLGISQEASQETLTITGDRLSGFVIPIEPITTDVTLQSLRAATWTIDDTKRLWLEGDVKINIGAYSFNAGEAAVWINRIPSAQGVINQIAVYFDRVSDPTKQAGLGAEGNKLLVTASTRGEITLNTALMEEKPPTREPILKQAEARLADYLKSLIAQPPPLGNRPQLQQPPPEKDADFVPVPGGTVRKSDVELPKTVALPPTETTTPWLRDPQGTVRFSASTIEIKSGPHENTISAIGSVLVDYVGDLRKGDLSQLTITADRGVIFTESGALKDIGNQVSASSVLGVYLEGNVSVTAQNGTYIIRAPYVYYDFQSGKAIMLDSLLRIQARDMRVPLFARAEEMRQLAANQWQADAIIASTSEFYTPHLAIGAQKMTITERSPESGPGKAKTLLDSRGNTMQLAGVPIIPWPNFKGYVEDVPLRGVEVGTRDNDGFRVLTTWDLFTLLGKEKPDGLDADLHVDAFTKRGAAAGVTLRYDVGDSEGKVDLYGMYDEGTDRTSSGRDVEPDQEFRGVALLEYQSQLSEYWSMQAQLSFISDPTFITSWREDDFAERREYETSLYLKHQKENAAFTLLGKYALNDFLSNSYLLASRQYSVDKAPELTYRRYGDSLFNDTVTYSTENRLTRMRLVFERATPREIGVRGSAFGIGDDDPIDDALRLRGLRENWVNRFDSRHEFALPMNPGIFNVTPFLVGRFTGYDDDFEDFSSDADSIRFFGAAGVRINTQFQKVDNSVENQLFDLHRLRHLVEPYLTLWSAFASVSQDDLPIYDEQVESLADGSAIQLGLRNTWQTQRGGPGRWRSVDVFTLDTSIVLDSEGEANESPTPQFFADWPEYSQMGDHVRAQASWLISDSLSLVGETTYALEASVFAIGSIGIELRHSSLLTTYIEYRTIEADDTQLLAASWIYQVSPKYRLQLTPQYDFNAEDFRALTARVTRSFPDFDFTLQFKYDKVRDDTSFGATIGLVQY